MQSHAQGTEPGWKFAISATHAQLTDLHSDSVGNTYLVGEFYNDAFIYGKISVPGLSGNEESNAFLAKIDPTGKPVWIRSIAGMNSGAIIHPGKSAINEKGELLLSFTASATDGFRTGTYVAATDVDRENTFLAKFTKTGFIAWVHPIKSVMDTMAELYVSDLFVDENGASIVTGYFRGTTAHLDDRTIAGTENDAMLFLASINERGDINWFNNLPYNESMDNGEIWPSRLRNTNSSYFYLAGNYAGYRPFYFGEDSVYDALDKDAFIARYNKDGVAQWVRSFSGDSLEYVEAIEVGKAGEVVVIGLFNSSILTISPDSHTASNGKYDLFLAKFDPDGNTLKSASIPVQHPYYESNAYKTTLKSDRNDNLMLCTGFFSLSLFSGAVTLVNPELGTSDMLICQLNPASLEPVWTKQGTAPGNNDYEGVYVDGRGNIYIAGTTYNALSVDTEDIPGNPSAGSPYMVRVKENGELDYVFWQENSSDNQIYIKKITGDIYGNSYVCGTFIGTANMLEGKPLGGSGEDGFFLAKYTHFHDIQGSVKTSEGDIFNTGYAKLFGRTLFQRAPLNDSVTLAVDGSFLFGHVPYGEYIVTIIPDVESSDAFVQTYYPSAEHWETATVIEVNEEVLPEELVIEMQTRADLTTGAYLEGSVTEQDSSDLFKNSHAYKGRPSKKATVVIAGNSQQKSTYEIVATTETDAAGNFSFTGVPDGFYYLWADIPGLPVEDAYFIEISGNQFISSLNYLVNEEKVWPEGLPIYSAISRNEINDHFHIYPNPAADYFMLQLLGSSNAIIDIFNSTGQHLNHIPVSEVLNQINVSGLVPGTYMIRVMTEDFVVNEKLTIIE
jgi:hypothetical protein